MGMKSLGSLFWKIFEATGSPNMYLLFRNSLGNGYAETKLHNKTHDDGDQKNSGL